MISTQWPCTTYSISIIAELFQPVQRVNIDINISVYSLIWELKLTLQMRNHLTGTSYVTSQYFTTSLLAFSVHARLYSHLSAIEVKSPLLKFAHLKLERVITQIINNLIEAGL